MQRIRIFLLLAFSLVTSDIIWAQLADRVGVPVTATKGITVSMKDIAEASRIYDQTPHPAKIRRELEIHLNKSENPLAPKVSKWSSSGTLTDGSNGINATQSIYSNFLGITLAEGQSYPPDCMGDVGSGQIVVAANTRLKVYNKNTLCAAPQTTTTGAGPSALASPVYSVDLDVFFNSVAGVIGTSDPHVRYDRLSQRWYIVVINLTEPGPNKCCIAVSSGPTITDLSSFTFFSFVADAGTSVPPSYVGAFFDYPTLGVDANALYIGGVMFNNAFAYLGSSLFVVRKSSILGAGPMVYTPFHNAGTSSTGIYVAQGVHNDDPSATQGYFIGTDAGVFSRLNLIRVTSPGGTPSISAAVPITVSATSNPMDPVAKNVPGALDAIDDRLYAAMVKTNKTDGSVSLWTAHNIGVTNAGVASASPTRTGTRWYQISNITSTPSVTQSGTLFDNAASTPRSYWMPSIAASGQGHALIGYSTAATTQFIDCGISGRYSGDAGGTIQLPVNATATTTAYLPSGDTPPYRFGDYSQTVVDPDDDMTMWSFVEYCNNTNSWGVRVIQAKAPAPPAITSVAGTIVPCSISPVTINGTNGVPEKFFDPGADAGGPGFAKRLAVTCTGGIIVSNVVFVNGTQINCNLNAAAAAPGNYTLTVTNPDCQSVSTTITVSSFGITGFAAGQRVCSNISVAPAGTVFTAASCHLIAKVVPSGAAPVSGLFNACAILDTGVRKFNGQPYVQRHFELEPAVNASAATATITLYFTQTEFNNYNLNRGSNPVLPTGAADVAGIANLRVVQFHGRGTDPNNYTEWTGPGASMVTIDPADNQVVWNISDQRWEVSFNATGFSGFYIMSYTPFNANASLCPGGNISLASPIAGSSYQWQEDTGGGFVNLSNVAPFSGTGSVMLQLTNAPSSLYGNKYRCVVNGVNSEAYVLKFSSWWLGGTSTAWANPANWACGAIPDANTDVYINSGKPKSPEVSTSVTVRSLTVNPATTVAVKQPDGVLNVLK